MKDGFHRWAIGARPRVSWSHCFFWLSFLTFSHIFSQFHFLWKAGENGCMALRIIERVLARPYDPKQGQGSAYQILQAWRELGG
jgi:hypothetical protein